MPNFGYLDWQRPVSGITAPVINDSRTMSTIPTNYGPLDVQGFSNLAITLANGSSALEVAITAKWRQNLNDTGFGITDDAGFNVAQQGTWLIPCRTPALDLSVSATGTDAGTAWQLHVAGTAFPLGAGHTTGNTPTLIADETTYAANGSQNLTATQWYTGRATVYTGSAAGAAARITLQYQNMTTLAWNTLYVIGVNNVNNAVPVEVFIPPFPFRVNVLNGPTGQFIDVFVVMAPRV